MIEKNRVTKILSILSKTYPDAKCALYFDGPFQLLVATILSAQCTDVRVNIVTPDLFKQFPTSKVFSKAELQDIETAIKSTGFYKNKAKSIKSSSIDIEEKYDGEVPGRLEELVKLRGVGRKTANVVLGNAFGVPGITVDTHIGRLSRRLGFTKHNDPVKVEFDLMDVIPKKKWTQFCHEMIYHGRQVCNSRKPKCSECPLIKYCPQKGVTNKA